MRLKSTIGLLAALGLLAMSALPATAQTDALVRVIHASPDAPNVDVWLDGERVLTDVPFTAVSDYLTVPAGDHNVQVTATGGTDPVIDADLTLEADTVYTVAATGMLADIAPVVLVDDGTPADGQSRLRVFHASPSAPASVDVAVADGPVLVEGLAYPEASGYLSVDPGTYRLEIRAAGAEEAALTIDATLAGAQSYTAIAMDGGDAGVQVIVAVDTQAVPDTAIAAPRGVPLGLIGLALVVAALGMTTRRLGRIASR